MPKGRYKRKKKTSIKKPVKNNPGMIIYDDMTIQVLSTLFEDGMTVGRYLRAGGKKSDIRAAVKVESISLSLPDDSTNV